MTELRLVLNLLIIFSSVGKVICIQHTNKPISVEDSGTEKQDVEVRKIYEDENGHVYYYLQAFGEDLKLILKRNDHLVTPEAEIIRRHNGYTISREKIADMDYHSGYLHSKPDSFIVVNVEDGYLTGIIVTDNHFMTINGLPEELPSKNGLKHVMTKRKHEENEASKSGAHLSRVSRRRRHARSKRSQPQKLYMEAMLVADSTTAAFYGNQTEQYLMYVADLVNALFQDHSIGDIKVVYTIVKLMVVSGDEKGLNFAENNVDDSTKAMSLFSDWVKQFYNPDEANPSHYDHASLVTKQVCGTVSCSVNGRSYLDGMCSSTRSVSMAVAAGMGAGLVLAHEIGHNFGLGHDSGNCAEGYIMQAKLSASSNAYHWSSCSRTTLQSRFSNKDYYQCLRDIPASAFLKTKVDVLNLNKNISGDEQCRLIFGPKYSHCSAFKTTCTLLYCQPDGQNVCEHRGIPPLEGTSCGQYKWCSSGKCVDEPIPPPVDGNWGAWSELTTCTRSCGVGVRYRTRECNNPKPEFYGKPCVGETKGQYETCNTQDCPSGTPTYREEQCKEKSSSYTSHYDGNECLLACKEGDVVSYFGTVKDGSRCIKDQYNYDVCVLGKCKKVGCDRKFSNKVFDRCGICDGSGNYCKLVKDKYTGFPSGQGADNAAVMFTLPANSTNLYVRELVAAYNEIGVKDMDGNWIIGTMMTSTVKYFDGTKIVYVREDSKYAETLTIAGPTTKPLQIMYVDLYETTNPGIEYQYYERLAKPTDISSVSFYWNSTLAKCNQTCAGGMQERIGQCYRADDNSAVGITNCDPKTSPSGFIACNTQACEPGWDIGSWPECSASCGNSGTRTRTVKCRRKISNTQSNDLPDDQCKEKKPKTVEECNRKDCAPDWEPGAWTKCSNKKCEGIQTRQLYCKQLLVTGEIKDLTEIDCQTVKPITELKCNSGVSCYDWRPMYPSCSQCEKGDLNYKKVGCYNMKTNLYGPELKTFDPSNEAKMVEECAKYAWERARRMFAVGQNGECYSSMDGHEVFYREQESTKCGREIGGDGAVYVYGINGEVLVSNQTCFYVEDDTIVASSNCKIARPHPVMKLCCEEICRDRCQKTVSGSFCSLPFVYKGRQHYDCVRDEQGQPWCSTTSNFDIDGQKENCEEPCRQRTKSGQCCSFPFIYRGRLYNTCITCKGCLQPWCSLTSNYDRDGMKGICDVK